MNERKRYKTKRVAVNIHLCLARSLVEEARKQGRSLTGVVNWVLFRYCVEQGYQVTSEDISEWSIRHRSYENVKEAKDAARAAREAAVNSEHGRDTGSGGSNPVPEIQAGNEGHPAPIDGASAGH